MALGEVQYRTHLPWPLVLVHVGLAAAVWALLVVFVTVLWRPPAALAARPHVD
jgi:heme A synthase